MLAFNKIHCIDVLKGLSMLESNTIDLVITSPPYNLGNNHHTGNNKHSAYNDNMPESEYQNWQKQVLNECYRVLNPVGSMLYNHKNRIKNGKQISPYEWIFKTEFIIKQEIVWVNRSQNFDKIRFYPFTERVYWLTKKSNTKLQNKISHSDVFDYKEWKPVGTKNGHTRQFPERMVEDLVSCFPNAELILDPFSGNGTTCTIAQKMGKNFIGFEINNLYCQESNKRIYNQKRILVTQ